MTQTTKHQIVQLQQENSFLLLHFRMVGMVTLEDVKINTAI
jgi:formamidopyrimidine-DNA glycosylase